MRGEHGFTLIEVLVSLAILGLAFVSLDYLQLQFISLNRAALSVHQAVQVSRSMSAYQFVHLDNQQPYLILPWQGVLTQGNIFQDNEGWVVTWGGFQGDVCAKMIADVRGCIPSLTQLDLRSLSF